MTSSSIDFKFFLPKLWLNIMKLKNVNIIGKEWRIIDIDDSFMKFLESEGIYLYDTDTKFESKFSDSEYDDIIDSDSNEKKCLISKEFNEKIVKIISELGAVVPKINWTVPTVI